MAKPAIEQLSLPVIASSGITIPNILTKATKAADRLAILLPGRGYTIHHPILHYLTGILLKHEWDVLRVQYAFQLSGEGLTPQQLPEIYQDTRTAIETALAHGYQRICWVGKSMGTPFVAQFSHEYSDRTCGIVHLTPIQQAVKMSPEEIPTLALIGTADPHYDAAHVAATAGRAQWRVFDALNHALEVAEDWRGSLHALESVLSACEHFIQTLDASP